MILGMFGIQLQVFCVLRQPWLFPAIKYARNADVKLARYEKTHEIPEPNTVPLIIIFLEDTRNGIG
jgi:hypothetical protein